MFTDPLSVSILAPHGDPTPAAKFREEFLSKRTKKSAAAEPALPQAREESLALRAHILSRVGRYFA